MICRTAPLRESADGCVARNIRARFGVWFVYNAGMLRLILECSPNRARSLYAGTRSYTWRELELVSAFFGVSPAAWLSEDAPQTEGGLDHRSHRDVLARAWDRLVTARETAG